MPACALAGLSLRRPAAAGAARHRARPVRSASSSASSAFAWLAVKLGLARAAGGRQLARSCYGVALLCGIGFTMSLFIGLLAFEDRRAAEVIAPTLGVLAGSLISALLGYLVLHTGAAARPQQPRLRRGRRSAAEQVVERDAGEHREPEQVVVQEGAEAGGGLAIADQQLLVHGERRGNQQPRPVPAAERGQPADQRQPARARRPAARRSPARSARPNRIADERMPITRSSSRSTIAYMVS